MYAVGIRELKDRQIARLFHSAAGLDEVSQAGGFGDAAALRHHFRRRLGLTPSGYRAQFGEAR